MSGYGGNVGGGSGKLQGHAADALRANAASTSDAWVRALEARSDAAPNAMFPGHALGALGPRLIEEFAVAVETGAWDGTAIEEDLRRLAVVRRIRGITTQQVLEELAPLLAGVRQVVVSCLTSADTAEALAVAGRLAEASEHLSRAFVEAHEEQPLAESLAHGRTLATFGRKLNHDLRNHIYAVQMQLRLLQEERIISDPARRMQLLERAKEALGNMTTVAPDQLAAFLGGQGTTGRSTPLVDLLGHLLDHVDTHATARGVTVRVEEPVPAVDVPDADRLLVALVEVVDNALRYGATAPRPTVVIRCRVATAPGGERQLVLDVVDNGRGIPKEQLPYLFALGTRGNDEQIPGEGAGLWLARHALEPMGARIEPASPERGGAESGAGSTFTITVPLQSRP